MDTMRLLEPEGGCVRDSSAQTIVFSENQSVPLSVIPFYSHRSSASIWKWKCHFTGGAEREETAGEGMMERRRRPNHHNLHVGRKTKLTGILLLNHKAAVPTVTGGIHIQSQLLLNGMG